MMGMNYIFAFLFLFYSDDTNIIYLLYLLFIRSFFHNIVLPEKDRLDTLEYLNKSKFIIILICNITKKY